ncbi:hypothetical protein COO60DRAFT_451733 [Scenedesmus sp. NREL 46B-D3]|nr:hypothetical protein COO60DRAFT_451733 [Scenedesmus sp. NREL 46B-D3]
MYGMVPAVKVTGVMERSQGARYGEGAGQQQPVGGRLLSLLSSYWGQVEAVPQCHTTRFTCLLMTPCRHSLPAPLHMLCLPACAPSYALPACLRPFICFACLPTWLPASLANPWQGTYQGELRASTKQLPATAAAAVAAAASALTSSAGPWDSMQMELEVTHTVRSRAYTWCHAALLVLAMILAHMGVFLLMAPWLAKLSGQEAVEGDSSSSSSDAKQQQFISAGLAEAGLYQKLLPEGADA